MSCKDSFKFGPKLTSKTCTQE